MKVSLLVAVVVLALAQGSLAQSVPDFANIGEYFEEMKRQVTQELTQLLNNQDLQNQAQSIQTQLEPVVAQLQEQLKTVAANVGVQTSDMQARVLPLVDEFKRQMETMVQKLTQETKAIGN